MADEGGSPLLRLAPPKTLARKKRKPAFPPPPERNLASHASHVARGLAEVRAHFADAARRLPLLATDVPYVRIEVAKGALLTDVDLRSLGLVPVYRREDAVLAAYARERDLSTFANQLDAYAKARKKLAALAKVESIKPWSREDRLGPRLSATEIDLLKEYTVDLLLMPTEDEQQNPQAVRAIDRFVEQASGRVVDRAMESTFSALRVRLGGQALNQMLDYRDDVALVDLPPAVEVTVPAVISLSLDDLPEIEAPPDTAPAICIVDSGILEGHPLLEAAIIASKSRSFPASLGPPVPQSPVPAAGHGTQVAGIALYADLVACVDKKEFVPALRLINARLLDDNNALHPDRMPLVREIVEHVQDTCRIFNLSLGLEPHAGFLSVPAVELDTITRENGVLFVVSSGNVDLAARYGGKRPGKAYPEYLLDDGWKVRSPGEALSALTVGGITPDGHLFRPTATKRTFAPGRAPSPFCSSGGIKNVVKPELVEIAGNVAHDSVGDRWVDNDAGLRVATTSHEFAAGKLLCFQHGTSFSTPKVAHLAARLLARYPEASPNLLRALLVQSARFPDGVSDWKKATAMRLIGFGVPDLDRALYCRPLRVTLYYEGEVQPDDVKVFEIPVPVEVAKARGKKRITVTIAYDPPVSAVHRDRPAGVQLTWGLARGDVHERVLHAAITSEADREVADEGDDKAGKSPFMKGALPRRIQQRGTVQKDDFEWTRGSYGETYRLAVTAKAIRPAHINTTQAFAVVVSIECIDDAVNVFNLVRTKLTAGRVRIRVPAG
jgi:hypothetical protein